VKLTDRRPAAPRPFEQVRPEVIERFLQQRREARIRQFVEELKSRARIEEAGP
jgi:parvulin-like peptidyl-prolyl isomerase